MAHTLAAMAQWVECWPANRRVASWIWSGHMPGSLARFPVGGMREATLFYFILFFIFIFCGGDGGERQFY